MPAESQQHILPQEPPSVQDNVNAARAAVLPDASANKQQPPNPVAVENRQPGIPPKEKPAAAAAAADRIKTSPSTLSKQAPLAAGK